MISWSGKVLASGLTRRKDQTRWRKYWNHDRMKLQALRKRFEPLLRRVFHLYWRFARGMTLGFAASCWTAMIRVFLVKHSYVSGWHLPGGGVEPGESFARRAAAGAGGGGADRAAGRTGPAWHVLQQPRLPPRPRRGLRDQAISARTGCPNRTVRSSPAASSTPARCRRRPPRVPGCGYRGSA